MTTHAAWVSLIVLTQYGANQATYATTSMIRSLSTPFEPLPTQAPMLIALPPSEPDDIFTCVRGSSEIAVIVLKAQVAESDRQGSDMQRIRLTDRRECSSLTDFSPAAQ